MKDLAFFILVCLLFFFLSNPFYYKSIANLSDKLSNSAGVPTFFGSLITTLIFGGLIILIYSITNSKEQFHFEVSRNRWKCGASWRGKPTSFQFTPDSDRSLECDILKSQDSDPHLGWGGMLGYPIIGSNTPGVIPQKIDGVS